MLTTDVKIEQPKNSSKGNKFLRQFSEVLERIQEYRLEYTTEAQDKIESLPRYERDNELKNYFENHNHEAFVARTKFFVSEVIKTHFVKYLALSKSNTKLFNAKHLWLSNFLKELCWINDALNSVSNKQTTQIFDVTETSILIAIVRCCLLIGFNYMNNNTQKITEGGFYICKALRLWLSVPSKNRTEVSTIIWWDNDELNFEFGCGLEYLGKNFLSFASNSDGCSNANDNTKDLLAHCAVSLLTRAKILENSSSASISSFDNIGSNSKQLAEAYLHLDEINFSIKYLFDAAKQFCHASLLPSVNAHDECEKVGVSWADLVRSLVTDLSELSSNLMNLYEVFTAEYIILYAYVFLSNLQPDKYLATKTVAELKAYVNRDLCQLLATRIKICLNLMTHGDDVQEILTKRRNVYNVQNVSRLNNPPSLIQVIDNFETFCLNSYNKDNNTDLPQSLCTVMQQNKGEVFYSSSSSWDSEVLDILLYEADGYHKIEETLVSVCSLTKEARDFANKLREKKKAPCLVMGFYVIELSPVFFCPLLTSQVEIECERLNSVIFQRAGGTITPNVGFSNNTLTPALKGDYVTLQQLVRVLNHKVAGCLQFFKLEGYVTDHCRLKLLLSECIGYLCQVESNMQRKRGYINRQIELMKYIMDNTNPSYFLELHFLAVLQLQDSLELLMHMEEAKIRKCLNTKNQQKMYNYINEFHRLRHDGIQYLRKVVSCIELPTMNRSKKLVDDTLTKHAIEKKDTNIWQMKLDILCGLMQFLRVCDVCVDITALSTTKEILSELYEALDICKLIIYTLSEIMEDDTTEFKNSIFIVETELKTSIKNLHSLLLEQEEKEKTMRGEKLKVTTTL